MVLVSLTMEGRSKVAKNAILCTCTVCCLIKRGFSGRSVQEQNDIIAAGRPTVPIHLETKVGKSTKKFTRHFHVGFYDKYEWLTGCKTLSRLFCWCCLLFNLSERSHWNSVGIRDLNNFHKSVKRHVNSSGHLTAIIKEKTSGKLRLENRLRIDNKSHNELVKKNRNILKRLIDVTCFLEQHDLGAGSYIDLLEFLGKYDETLRNHLKQDASTRIHHDLIACTGSIVSDHIKEEVAKAPFLSVVLNEFDSSRLSVIVRYINPSNGSLQERFLKTLPTSDRTAETIFRLVREIVEDLECGSKFIALSCDGAAVMSSNLEDFQIKLKEKYPHVMFVHYWAHNLVAVLSQGMGNITECKRFFSTLSGMTSFLSNHLHQIENRSVQAVSRQRDSLMKFFESVWNNKERWDADTVTASKGYLYWLRESFEFNFLLNILADIYPEADADILQLNDVNLCITRIIEFEKDVIEKRERFEYYWEKTVAIVNLEPRKRRFKTDDDDDDTISSFYCRLYQEVFDNILQQLGSRSHNFIDLRFVDLCHFNKRKFPTKSFDSLRFNFGSIFDVAALQAQLSVVYDTSWKLDDRKTALDLLKYLETTGLDKSLKEVVQLCRLVLTIPFNAPAESMSGSSVLERVENFIGRSAGKEDADVSNLGLLSVERECVKELMETPKFHDNIIDKFATIDKRMELYYK